jgi:hypothetical protein
MRAENMARENMARENMAGEELAQRRIRNALYDELREMIWLASIVSGLSVAGVGLAVVLGSII